jgi:hypothetical protein
MEQYQLLPLVLAVSSLIGGMLAGVRLHRYSWAPKAKPYAYGLLILAILFGSFASNWLAGVLALVIGSKFVAAMIAVALLSFTSGVIFALCGDAKKSQQAGNDKD